MNTTAYPYFDFGSSAELRRPILGFVVADPEEPCTPSWGGYFTLQEAATELRLDQQITQLRNSGQDVVVSFGGAAEDELSTACEDSAALYDAYRTVIDRYELDTVDFDVEMDDLGDREANQRRAEAVLRLQEDRPKNDPLRVWATLPVGPQGLDEDSQDVVAQLLNGGVELAGVNLMIMNFGENASGRGQMVETSVTAARSAQSQIKELYAHAGQELSDDLVWNRMGLTPMIGQNDIRENVVDQSAAEELNRFAREQGVGRLSFWSLNRDRSCGSEQRDLREATDLCSGIQQQPGDFTEVLSQGFEE
ncbi:chitinase [Kocuria nitroreducens]|uniref:chitinase n=1 Tax=Kocuria nitroreducens TaxID=3058914 RepID=UPI0036DEB2CC